MGNDRGDHPIFRQAMESEIHSRLEPIRERLHQRAILRSLGPGLLAGSAIAVAVAIWKCSAPPLTVAAMAVVPLVVGPVVAAWVGWNRKPGWLAVAATVDRHCRLEDRTVTALSFAEEATPRPINKLQIGDALAHLDKIDARAVVPGGVPRHVVGGSILFVVAVAVIAWPVQRVTDRAPSTTGNDAGSRLPEESLDQPVPVSETGDVGWQVAPDRHVATGRAGPQPETALEEIATRAASPAPVDSATTSNHPPDEPADIVLEPEPVPPEHRETIRRYFEAIRPQEDRPQDGPTAEP